MVTRRGIGDCVAYPHAPDQGAAFVEDRVVGDPEQPGQCRIGDVPQAAPRGGEHLAHDVVCGMGSDPADGVGANRPRVELEEIFEALMVIGRLVTAHIWYFPDPACASQRDRNLFTVRYRGGSPSSHPRLASTADAWIDAAAY